MSEFVKDSNSSQAKKTNDFYQRFNEIQARKLVEEEFQEIEKIKSNKNTKLPNVEYVVEMLNISKSFNNGKIIANDEVNLLVAKNEIHAIIGENGAGKSTLMSILFGIYAPDDGIIKINGKEVNFKSARDATLHKIGMVHQHFKLVPTYNVFENIVLGSEEIDAIGLLKNDKATKKLNKLINHYNLGISLKSKISKLSVSEQQKVEILKLLYRDSNILIFDEPTAVLSPFEIVSFLKILKVLQKEGKTIIIITHKFEEVKDVADQATIIRHGRFIANFEVKSKSIAEMAELMVGKKIDEIVNKNHSFAQNIVLEVKNLNLAKILTKNKAQNSKAINFSIKEGEIFAIAGVDGNGQRELALVISGMIKDPNAKIVFNNQDISHLSINKRYKMGLSHVPEDRQKSGLILDMPCYINLVSNKINELDFSIGPFDFWDKKNILKRSQKTLDILNEKKSQLIKKFEKSKNVSLQTEIKFTSDKIKEIELKILKLNRDLQKEFRDLPFRFIKNKSIQNYSQKLIETFDVRGALGGAVDARSLSGGNQQKLIVARELTNKHKLIIMVQPTRGLDLGAIEYIHCKILEEKQKGNAILLISYELSEILALADTIAVINKGVFVDVSSAETTSRQKIGELMLKK